MIRTIITIFLFGLMTNHLYSQELMSKEEIYLSWNKHENDKENPNNYKVGFNSNVSVFIDSLKECNVDTIGVYQQDHVGYIFEDSCMCGIIPWEAYVHWINNGKTYHQKFTECCRFDCKEIKYSVLINYYVSAKTKIDSEKIMPVITGTSRNEEGDILINFNMIDHTTDYTFYCSLNGYARFTRFQYFDLEDSKGIFYKDNLNSSINSWRKMVDYQIKQIENE